MQSLKSCIKLSSSSVRRSCCLLATKMLIAPQSKSLKSLTYCVDSIPLLLRPFMWMLMSCHLSALWHFVCVCVCLKFNNCIHFFVKKKRERGGKWFLCQDTHKIKSESGWKLNLTNPADLWDPQVFVPGLRVKSPCCQRDMTAFKWIWMDKLCEMHGRGLQKPPCSRISFSDWIQTWILMNEGSAGLNQSSHSVLETQCVEPGLTVVWACFRGCVCVVGLQMIPTNIFSLNLPIITACGT